LILKPFGAGLAGGLSGVATTSLEALKPGVYSLLHFFFTQCAHP
jgi:hypothetical protein